MHSIVLLLGSLAYLAHCRRLKAFTAGLLEEGVAESQLNPTCTARMDRLATLDNQMLGESVGRDPSFLPDITSIASPGTKCGDSAQNIKKKCGKFYKWQTFQEVASKMQKPFKVMEGQVKFSDINQGQLGNCYFLAALAAVAVNHPDVINDMFIERPLWGNNEFKSRWLINGRMQTIVVDNMIPAEGGSTFFTGPSATGAFWPVILGKAWAKIFGSFKAVESGVASDVVQAMTRAPARYINIEKSTETSIRKILADSMKNKHPMVAGTCKSCAARKKFGLAGGHDYAVLDSYELRGETVVKMYNPWGRHNFKGKLKQTEELNGPGSGVFTMLVREFFKAFDSMTVTYVMAGYQVSSQTIPANQLYATQLSVSTPGKFWVSLVWPSPRLVEPCPYLQPKVAVNVQLSTDKGALVGRAMKKMRDDNDLAVEIENGVVGTYDVLAELDYKDNSTWMSSVQLTVYGPATTAIKDHPSGPKDLAMEMVGPACKVASLPKVGLVTLDMETAVFGIPTYWSLDRKYFLYYNDDKWYSSKAIWMVDVLEGNITFIDKYSKEDFRCGCHDSDTGITGWGDPIPCDEANRTNQFKCSGGKDNSDTHKFCPVTCGVCPPEASTSSSISTPIKGSSISTPIKESASASGPTHSILDQVGPACEVASLPKVGLVIADMKKLMFDVPTYWSLDGKHFAYYYAKEELWYVSTPKRMDDILKRDFWSTYEYSKEEFSCGCHDSVIGIEGWGDPIPCDEANRTKQFKCSGGKDSSDTHKFCPVTCGTCP